MTNETKQTGYRPSRVADYLFSVLLAQRRNPMNIDIIRDTETRVKQFKTRDDAQKHANELRNLLEIAPHLLLNASIGLKFLRKHWNVDTTVVDEFVDSKQVFWRQKERVMRMLRMRGYKISSN